MIWSHLSLTFDTLAQMYPHPKCNRNSIIAQWQSSFHFITIVEEEMTLKWNPERDIRDKIISESHFELNHLIIHLKCVLCKFWFTNVHLSNRRALDITRKWRCHPGARRPGTFETTRDVTVSGVRRCKWGVNKIRVSENTLSFTTRLSALVLDSRLSALGIRPSRVYRVT